MPTSFFVLLLPSFAVMALIPSTAALSFAFTLSGFTSNACECYVFYDLSTMLITGVFMWPVDEQDTGLFVPPSIPRNSALTSVYAKALAFALRLRLIASTRLNVAATKTAYFKRIILILF